MEFIQDCYCSSCGDKCTNENYNNMCVECYNEWLEDWIELGVFMLTKDTLDCRVCDCEPYNNTQTYREFIRGSEDEFEIEHADIDSMSNAKLQNYLAFLDELWLK